MTDEKLAEIEQRANAATKWTLDKCKVRPVVEEDGCRYRPSPPECTYLPGTNVVFSGGYENGGNDWAFLAHARSDVPALVSEVRRLRALLGEARESLFDLGDASVFASENGYEDLAAEARAKADDLHDRIDAALRGES